MAKTKKTAPIDPNDFAKAFFDGIVSRFALDPEKTSGRGTEFAFLPYGYLLIHYAGSNNKAYQKAQKDFIEQHGSKIDTMSEADQNRHMAKIYADSVIVGLLMPDKTAVPYDAQAKKLCADALTKLPNILEKLIVAAKDEANFRVETDKANAKNS
jgi:hypothetical protein